jgi:hypothetical protein
MENQKGKPNPNFYYVQLNVMERYGIRRFKANEGKNFLCILPPANKKGYFGKVVHIHTKIGPDNYAFLCLRKMFGEKCPICTEYMKIKWENSSDGRVKRHGLKVRHLFFIIDVSSSISKLERVQWYNAPNSVGDAILDLSGSDEDEDEVIDISDPIEGKDFCFTRTGVSWQDTRYSDFYLEDRDPIPEEWYELLPTFDKVLRIPDRDYMREEFLRYCPGDEKI